ncbi:hypothetical protein SLS53_000523 [Cytospora paraplurivora]|uniref:O-methyltransferase n=1 Tax=Cytospora paraplurivora TaxID=2898453 RepID=A0AAN9UN54_9PEZI
MTTSRIVELSQRIAVNTAKVHDYLAAHDLPEPSFALDAPPVSIIPEANTNLFLIAIELARAFPALQLVVQDLDEPVVKEGDSRKPSEVAGRVRFMVHDFLTPQPVRAAILRALIPVLEPGAKIVINDSVMPGPGTLPWDREARLRGNYLNMLELQNAGDREIAEWEKLFRQADGRFVFKGAWQPEGSRGGGAWSLWILEVEWKA